MADAEREVDDALSGNVLSVQELNDRIASVVQDTPALNGVRCIGEVTDLHQNSTALYFTLTDGNAELPCMLWANRYQKMDADLEDGTEVILEGDIDYWTEGGKIDLKPWEVIVVGDGDQAAAVERLRSELEERGWFDDEQKQQPPAFPERVGVVTSLRGDARYDIQNAIHGQDPTVDILVKDATVQGSEAPMSIANGIHHLDRSEDVDERSARRLVGDLVEDDVVTPVPDQRALVHEPSGEAFDSITQLAVFHRGWQAATDVDTEDD
jgi:exodeoxyribonuclease VII large subunit